MHAEGMGRWLYFDDVLGMKWLMYAVVKVRGNSYFWSIMETCAKDVINNCVLEYLRQYLFELLSLKL